MKKLIVLTGRLKVQRRIKNKIEDVPVPRKIYIQEILEMYNRACMSEDIFVKYISYYNILEFFYETLYNEHLIDVVRTELIKPDFSTKNNKTIMRLVESIKNEVKVNRDNSFNEKVALKLVLEKYICVEDLKKILKTSPELYKHYNQSKVGFSDGVALNFNDQANVLKNLVSRIYLTRNALIHSKSSENTLSEYKMYKPFQDVSELEKELLLMRTIAEMIIFKTGTEL